MTDDGSIVVSVSQSHYFVQRVRAGFALDGEVAMLADAHTVFDLLVRLLGDEKFGAGLLVGALDAAGEVHGVADGGEPPAVAGADGPEDYFAVMDPDADAEVDLELRLEIGLHGLYGPEHLQPGADGVERRAGGIVGVKERHQPVADEIVDLPVVMVDDRAHPAEVPIQHVDDVVGQVRLGERREVADVGEQDGEVTLLAHTARRRATRHLLIHQLHVLVVQHQAAQGHVAAHGRLARQAHHRAEIAARRHLLLFFVARAAIVQALQNQYPARRAARIPAADVRVRDAMLERGLQDGRGRVYFNQSFVLIRDMRHTDSPKRDHFLATRIIRRSAPSRFAGAKREGKSQLRPQAALCYTATRLFRRHPECRSPPLAGEASGLTDAQRLRGAQPDRPPDVPIDRKSTRLNSS